MTQIKNFCSKCFYWFLLKNYWNNWHFLNHFELLCNILTFYGLDVYIKIYFGYYVEFAELIQVWSPLLWDLSAVVSGTSVAVSMFLAELFTEHFASACVEVFLFHQNEFDNKVTQFLFIFFYLPCRYLSTDVRTTFPHLLHHGFKNMATYRTST